jgi:DNA-binding MarR family transcriptional regulator
MGEEITLPQYRALIVLAARGAMRPVDLAEELSITASTATRLCDRLVQKDLISRARTEADRRTVELDLTPRGKKLLEDVTTARRGEIARILGALPASDRAVVTEGMTLFAKAAGEREDGQWRAGWEL